MTYQDKTNRLQDFDVHYRFFTSEEGGRKTGPPFQGYRCDWSYEGDDVDETGIYMIWPEFEDNEGNVIPEKTQVQVSGKARMWIVSQEMTKEVHEKKVNIGVKGYFMEGGKKVAEAEIVSVVGLCCNET